MRIGFDAKRYFYNTSGLGIYARWLVDGLAERKMFDYHLYQPKEVSQKVELPTHFPTGIGKATPSLWRSKFVCSRLENDGIHIFHGLSNEIPFGIHKTAIKAIVTIHDLINKRYPENYKTIDRIIYNKKLHYAQKHAAKIITPSIQTKQDIIQFYDTPPDKIEVIPLSMTPIEKAPQNDLNIGEYILCVSSFSKRKNIPRLIEAFNLLHNAPIKLVLAGHTGDTLKEVEYLASKNKNIIVKKSASRQELNALYTNALFCVYPSVFEGFGIPILEAFSFGKTVATSKSSSMPEVGGYAAIYFDPESTESIAQSISQLLNAEQRSQLEQHIPIHLQNFESNAILQRYEHIYSEVISS